MLIKRITQVLSAESFIPTKVMGGNKQAFISGAGMIEFSQVLIQSDPEKCSD